MQFCHRTTAYLLVIITLGYVLQVFRNPVNRVLHKPTILLITLLITQVGLGIATVVSSIGQVPVGLGVAHQFTAIALVGALLYVNYIHRPGELLGTVDNLVEKRG